MINMSSEVSLISLKVIKTANRHSKNTLDNSLILQQLSYGGILRTTKIEIITYKRPDTMFTCIHDKGHRHPWRRGG